MNYIFASKIRFVVNVKRFLSKRDGFCSVGSSWKYTVGKIYSIKYSNNCTTIYILSRKISKELDHWNTIY